MKCYYCQKHTQTVFSGESMCEDCITWQMIATGILLVLIFAGVLLWTALT